MKINLVLPHQLPFPPTRGGGVENLNWLLAREFAACGHEVTAYSRVVSEKATRETDEHGIRHIRVQGYDLLPNRWLDHVNALRYAWNLRGIIEPADVTSFHTPFSFLLCGNSRLGVCTHTIHRTPKFQLPLYRRLDRLYCGSDAVVAQARQIAPGISNLKRIYNCIALPPKAPLPLSRDKDGGLRFLYVGRFVADKGIVPLVEGFELSLVEFPANTLSTLGPQKNAHGADDHFFEKMSRYIRNRKLTDKVIFRPPIYDRNELNEAIALADVICVPSLSGETFSMVILEAMAIGKPVLVSDFGPMEEAVEHRVTGYVSRTGDPKSIAEGIRFFSERPHELAVMGEAGFEKARTCFSVQRIASEYLEDFEALVHAKSSASYESVNKGALANGK